MADLKSLIAGAAFLAGDDLCKFGHVWESDGGRACPNEWDDKCGQTVYRCARCGQHDYGERGGPAYADCDGCMKGPPDEI